MTADIWYDIQKVYSSDFTKVQELGRQGYRVLGFTLDEDNDPYVMFQKRMMTCGSCSGTGEGVQYDYEKHELVKTGKPCGYCDGNGSIQADEYSDSNE